MSQLTVDRLRLLELVEDWAHGFCDFMKRANRFGRFRRDDLARVANVVRKKRNNFEAWLLRERMLLAGHFDLDRVDAKAAFRRLDERDVRDRALQKV
ncbi:hypothetical protein M3I53_07300 [Paraburkholderia sp. CNPSo 3272]|nr:hypothetical protein [Paraburkholderia sp. CNPSo 3272]